MSTEQHVSAYSEAIIRFCDCWAMSNRLWARTQIV